MVSIGRRNPSAPRFYFSMATAATSITAPSTWMAWRPRGLTWCCWSIGVTGRAAADHRRPVSTATPTPPTADCLCVPIQVVPQGNLVALKNVSDGGKGSKLTRTVTVKMEAREVSPGSCPHGDISAPTPLNLKIVDDDGDVIIDSTKGPFVCESGKAVHTKFWMRYEGPENCKGSAVPSSQTSKGDLLVTATTSDGSLDDIVLDDTLRIQCKR